jgi:hypothetical protein
MKQQKCSYFFKRRRHCMKSKSNAGANLALLPSCGGKITRISSFHRAIRVPSASFSVTLESFASAEHPMSKPQSKGGFI